MRIFCPPHGPRRPVRQECLDQHADGQHFDQRGRGPQDFYRGKYPNAMFSTRDEHSQSIVVKTDKGAIAVVVESLGEGRRTKISISRWEGVAPPK